MQNIFGTHKKNLTIIVSFFICQILNAQCPVVTCPSSCAIGCTTPATVIANSNYSANVTSRWIGPGNIPISSFGTSTSVVNINAAGMYTVEFKDNLSNCVVTSTLLAVSQSSNPTFGLVANSFTQNCPNSILIINIINGNTFPFAGGAISYTAGPGFPPALPPGTLGVISTYTVNTCGNYYFMVRDNFNGCTSSHVVSIGCSTLTLPTITITGNNTVCAGSSTTLTATGANTYSWSNNSTAALIALTPSANTCFSVSGTNAMGCTASASTCILVNTTCSQVWPGDANSDGVVNSSDVLELGLQFSSTGTVRTPSSNVYNSQYAGNWTGTVTSGKNKCHADCNGDGVVNNSDTVAIYNNFLQTHTFRISGGTSVNPAILLVPEQKWANAGLWNRADIFLGDSIKTLTQLYGLTFDIDYDQAMIENNSVYIVYTPSFLNATGQNIQFRKTIFNAGKIYAASVRTDGTNVNGNGKIGEFYYKVKTGLPDNSVINLSISNPNKIDKTGTGSSLSGTATALTINNNPNPVGISSTNIQGNMVQLFPNPSTGMLNLQSNLSTSINYFMVDVLGREILKGEFTNSKTLDIAGYENGTYFIRFESVKNQVHKKLVIEK